MSHLTIPPTLTSLTQEQFMFLQEQIASIQSQNKHLELKTIVGAVNRTFVIKFGSFPAEEVIKVSIVPF